MPPDVREALDSPIPARDIGLTVFAAPFVGVAPKASIALVIEFDPGALTFVQKDGTFNTDLEIHLLAIDAAGKVQGGGRDVAPLRLREANYATVMKNGLRITRRLELPPGRYQIHVGRARDERRQARDHPAGPRRARLLEGAAPDERHRAHVGIRGPHADGRIPTPGSRTCCPASPTAIREFPRSDTLALFAEVYDNQTRAPHRVAITTTVAGDDGRVLFTTDDERSSEELQGKKGGYGYTRRSRSRSSLRAATCCASRPRRSSPTAARPRASWSSAFDDVVVDDDRARREQRNRRSQRA